MLTFFGLTPEYRANLFSTIHDIVFHGNGGYDYHTVYDMPVWLRKFTVLKLNEHYDNQNKQIKNANKSTLDNQPVRGPNISSNTYTTKARK